MTVVASHYDSCKKDRFNPCGLTSSGEPFFPERADNAASPVLPDGTVVMVWSKATKQAVVLRINNAGPYWGNRKLDLSRAAARTLGIAGVGEVTLRVLTAPTPAEARYAKNRRYAAGS
jgi:rare lipoprotein A